MKRMLSSTRRHHMRTVGVFLILSVLTVGMAGCGERMSQDLEISTWYDLDQIRNNLAGHHKLMNDLDATTDGYDKLAGPAANSKMGWRKIGSDSRPFTGTFDGQGYEIRDLFVHRPNTADVGLFGVVAETGVIKNTGLVNSSITGSERVGALVGANRGTVADSYAAGNVSGVMHVGGLLGDNRGTTVDSSAAAGVTGLGYVGGLVGHNAGTAVVDYCHASGNVTGRDHVGGLVGHSVSWYSAVLNSYATGNVAGSSSVGGLVGYGGRVHNSHYSYNDVLINGQNIITVGALPRGDFSQWLANGRFLDVDERLAQLDGYYVIEDVSDLKQLLAFGQDGALRFKLQNDLNLQHEFNFYIPNLSGEFHGNGHNITNFNVSLDFVSQVGLFGHVGSHGKVTAIGIDNGSVVGAAGVGLLVGLNRGTVTDAHSSGSATGLSHVGGLVGWNTGSVTWSRFEGNVTGDQYVGGLTGLNYDMIGGCRSSGMVTGLNYVGGLAGSNWGYVMHSYSDAGVHGEWAIGGLAGYNEAGFDGVAWWGVIKDSYSAGDVNGITYVGGLAGVNRGAVNNCYSLGGVTGDYGVGGLLGWGSPSDNSFWNTQTSGQAASAGGAGKTTAEMQSIVTFTDTGTVGLDEPWDIAAVGIGERNVAYIWNIVDGVSYPFLSWQSG